MAWIVFSISICALGWIAGTVKGKARIGFVALAILAFCIYAYSLFAS